MKMKKNIQKEELKNAMRSHHEAMENVPEIMIGILCIIVIDALIKVVFYNYKKLIPSKL